MKSFPALISIGLFVGAVGIASIPFVTWAEPRPPLAQATSRSFRQIDTPRFSIQYPSHWIVTGSGTDFLNLFNQVPQGIYGYTPFMVSAKVGFLPGSIDEERRNAEREMPSRFIKRETLEIGGKQAVRQWREYDDIPTNGITTYIRYSDRETAYVESYYNKENSAAEAVIIQVHNSLTLRP